MLNITTITRRESARVANYYADAADDYYAKDGEQMQWLGTGAENIGLPQSVESDRFRELMAGKIDEDTSLRRVKLQDFDKERLGYDLTFSAPKGVTLQALVNRDESIINAHDNAVKSAIAEAEKLAMARKTENGKTSREETGNLVVGAFRHETSRELDPQLHTHAFVMNMTQRQDGEWRALTNDGILKSVNHLGNVYKASLAKELKKEGFNLRFNSDGSFDLANISEEQTRHFSKRSQQIEEALEEKGLNRATATTAEKNQLSLATRRKKEGGIDPAELHDIWKDRANNIGINFDRDHWAGDNNQKAKERDYKFQYTEREHADECVNFAIDKLKERQTLINHNELQNTALKHGFGLVDNESIQEAIKRSEKAGNIIKGEDTFTPAGRDIGGNGQKPELTFKEWKNALVNEGKNETDAINYIDNAIKKGRLVKEETRYTTPEAKASEKSILDMEKRGRDNVKSIANQKEADKFLKNKGMEKGQRDAVIQMTTSTNRFSAVQGYAGTGKSYMTTAAQELLEKKGYKVKGLAAYNAQVKNLESEGIKSQTVASFVKGKKKDIDDKTVLVLDEAGVMPTHQMEKVMRIAEKNNARLVMMGDTSQTKAIEAGKPMEQLMENGIQTAYMTEIRRQKDSDLLEAVEYAAEGNAAQSLDKLNKMENVYEINDPDERYRQLAKDYVSQNISEQEQSIIVSGTNQSRRDINDHVRDLKGLKGKGEEFDFLHRKDATEAEKKFSSHYDKGSIIIPERDYKNGLNKGEQYKVIDNGPNNSLTVKDKKGKEITFNPVNYKKISNYSTTKEELSIGDTVRMQRGNKDLGLDAGEKLKVEKIKKDDLILKTQDKRKVKMSKSDALMISHAYATTVHSSQGLTENRVFANLDSKSKTTSKEVFYVAISRARNGAHIYTNNKDELPSAVSRGAYKPAALELNNYKSDKQKVAQRFKEQRAKRLQKKIEKEEKEKSAKQIG